MALATLLLIAGAGMAPAQTPDSSAWVTVRLRSGDVALAFARVRTLHGRATETNASGVARLRIGAGLEQIISSKFGFRPDTVALRVITGRDTTIERALAPLATELGALVVNATRAGHTIGEEPVRVEVLAGEELDEKSPMRPQDLTNFVAEISGVRVRQLAPGRGGAAIRIQGLQGQYTQVLVDGLPLPGSLSTGLVLMQLPPLDLAQVEVIKGSATALFGPAALGGVVNLVSRRPDNVTEVLVSGHAPAGGDAFLWTSRQLTPTWGYSVIADAHAQVPHDRNGDAWMDLAGYRRVSVRPRVLWNGTGGGTLFATAGVMAENRDGGTIAGRLAPDGAAFDEGIDTRLADGGFWARVPLTGSLALLLRGSGVVRALDQHFGAVRERGTLGTLFGEAALSVNRGTVDGLLGVAWERDSYRSDELPRHDFTFRVPAVFAQATVAPVRALAASVSARCDAHSRYGTICSPRASLLFKPEGDEWGIRLSAGTGFFAPTPFVEKIESIGLSPLRQLSGLRAERGQSVALDINGDIEGVAEVTVTLFASEIRHPAVVRAAASDGDPVPLELVNAPSPSRATGAEVLLIHEGMPFSVTAHYAYLRATEADPANGARREAGYNPRHNGFVDVSWSTPNGFRVGLEASWVGTQVLEDDPYRARSKSYATIELLVWKRFGGGMLWASAENLTDVRQTRYAPLLRAARPPGESWTVGQWAPMEGRVLNLGFRLQL